MVLILTGPWLQVVHHRAQCWDHFCKQMRVSVNGAYFDWAKFTSGVPQGSLLEPFLFLLYVNDIPTAVSCKIKQFADDTKIWNTIKTQSDSHSLQSDIDLLRNDRTNGC